MTDSPTTSTLRSRAKADRRAAMLAAAAHLFAERGFARVSLEDLGSAVGVSGPAFYRHFAGKQAVLGALLVGVSEGLASGGRAVVGETPDAAAALRALIAFHVDFALANADVIRVQDRDLDSLAEPDRHDVRALQRTYVELWVDVLGRLQPDVERSILRTKAHATFGLINSTPHSSGGGSARGSDRANTRAVLERMAAAALGA